MNTRNFSITETVAAIGVIASLLFVGYEIRQGNEVARNEALSAFAAATMQTSLELAGNERVSILMARSWTESWEDFTPSDQLALANITVGLLKWRDYHFKQLKLGILKPGDIVWPPADNGFYTSEMQHVSWPRIRKWVSEDFAVFWEQRYGLLKE